MELTEIGKNPILDTAPAGKDIRSESIFEELSSEINKTVSLSGGQIDWQKVRSLSQKILTELSKDILVWSYFSVSLLKTEGLKEFGKSIKILYDMIENYWDNLFPPKNRIKGRINAIQWWLDTVSETLENYKSETWKKEEIDEFFSHIDRLDSLINEKFEGALSIFPLNPKFAALINEEARQEEKIEPPQKKTEITTGIIVPETIDLKNIEKTLSPVFEVISKVCNALQNDNSFTPLYIRLNRFVAWSLVESLPEHDEKGVTMVPPVEDYVVSMIKELKEKSLWKELVSAVESRIPQYLFWLDLNYYSAEALKKMGFIESAREVESQTLFYVRRLRGVENLYFSDGSPFASIETREWLEKMQVKDASKDKKESAIEIFERERETFESILSSDGLPSAVSFLVDSIKSAKTEKERFIKRVFLCRILMKHIKPELLEPHFYLLIEEIDKFRVDFWEPELAVQALSTIATALKIKDTDTENPFYQQVIKRLSLLSPSEVLKIIS